MSIIVILVVSFFAFVRFQTMLEYGETTQQKTTNSMVVDDSEFFSRDQTNFMVAFNLIGLFEVDPKKTFATKYDDYF